MFRQGAVGLFIAAVAALGYVLFLRGPGPDTVAVVPDPEPRAAPSGVGGEDSAIAGSNLGSTATSDGESGPPTVRADDEQDRPLEPRTAGIVRQKGTPG